MTDAAGLQQQLRDAVEKASRPEQPKPPTGLPTSVSADLMQPVSRSARIMSLSLVTAILAAIAWSVHAEIEERTAGQGTVVPAGKVQLVQNLEGGIISAIAVKTGDRVSKDQLLLRIDPTGADSSLKKNREYLAGFRAKIIRFTARLANKPLEYSTDFTARYPDLVKQNLDLYKARSQEIKAALSALDQRARQKLQEKTETESHIRTLKAAIAIADEELAMTTRLARDAVVSKAELLAARSKSNDLAGQLEALELSLPRLRAGLAEINNLKQEKQSRFEAETLGRLNETQVKYAALGQTIKADRDKVKRTEVRSPVAGIVKTLHINTIGQVVKPGADLVEIVPVEETLLVETRIRPRDIAFLSPGQKAVVKLTAYDYALYGSLKGRLERIGADSITNERGETYYVVDVRTNENYLQHKDKKLPIKPGMVAQVDIMTGKKTIFNYMTKPMHRMANEALRER